jgi:hypothetical protein
MKKARKSTDELRSKYSRSDFGPFVRGKCVERLHERSNIVVIAPDIADLFPNGVSVNAALRALAEIAKRAGCPAATLVLRAAQSTRVDFEFNPISLSCAGKRYIVVRSLN